MKRIRNVLAIVICACMVFLTGCLAIEIVDESTAQNTNATVNKYDKLEIHCIDVGQGDATLFICGGEAMLVDTGDNLMGGRIVAYAKNQGVTEFKYIIATHPDSDHIGGLDVILDEMPCKTLIMTEEKKNNSTYEDVISAINRNKTNVVRPEVGNAYTLGDAIFTIVGPVKYLENDVNNNCIAFMLNHGDVAMFFGADAKEEEEADMIATGLLRDVDVYKVGHHGSKYSSSEAFLDVLKPEYALISCEEYNEYGYPHARVLNTLRSRKVEVYRTDEQGCIVLTSDGEKCTFNMSPSDSWLVGDRSKTQADVYDDGNGTIYVLNLKSMKFHVEGCENIADIKDYALRQSNKYSKEELIEMGYSPCKGCMK